MADGGGAVKHKRTLFPVILALIAGTLMTTGVAGGQTSANVVTDVQSDAFVEVVLDAKPDDGQDFQFSVNIDQNVLPSFTLDDDTDPTQPSSQQLGPLPTGGYAVITPIGSLPNGWTITAVECTETNATSQPGVVRVHLDPGDQISCTFTIVTAFLDVVLDAQPNDAQDFEFYVPQLGADFMLDDDSDAALPASRLFGPIAVAPGFTSIGILRPAVWALTAIDCTETPLSIDLTGPNPALPGGGVALSLDPGDRIRCTFTVVNNLPVASAAAASIAEGQSGTSTVNVPITLNSAATQPVSVQWATSDLTTTAGSDYQAASGLVSFAAGESSKTVPVTINGDTAIEPTEFLRVSLSNPVGAALGQSQATVTIVNDDDTTAPVISFKEDVISESKAAQVVVPYTAPIAKDAVDAKVTVNCLPKSGSSFPSGSTLVRCTAEDRSGNVAASSFKVIVRLPTTPGAVTDKLGTILSQLAAKEHVYVGAGGFDPKSKVELHWIAADGSVIDLEQTRVGKDGRFDEKVKLPKNTPLGLGQMTAVGIAPDGSELVRAWLLTVVDA